MRRNLLLNYLNIKRHSNQTMGQHGAKGPHIAKEPHSSKGPIKKRHHSKSKPKAKTTDDDMQMAKNPGETRPLATLSYIAGMSNNNSINNNSSIQIDLDLHTKVNVIDVTIIARYFGLSGEIFHVR